MVVETYTAQLERVQAAIAAIEAGAQQYTIQTPNGQRVVRRAELATLYKRESELRVKASREQAGVSGPRVRYGVKV